MTIAELATSIDHTILRQTAVESDVVQLCNEALHFGFPAVCIQPCFVQLAASILTGTKTAVCTVVGFPMGCNSLATKLFEAEQAVRDGARELDMVMNISLFKSGLNDMVLDELTRFSGFCVKNQVVSKVIIETGLLSKDEIANAMRLLLYTTIDYAKTSTGYFGPGANPDDVKLMAGMIDNGMRVKASGGIKTLDQALSMLRAGAHRLGTSSAVAIIEELRVRQEGLSGNE